MIALLEQNPENIDWCYLSRNPNAKAVKLLQQNPDKINWSWLTLNPNKNAINLLLENPEKIHWKYLSSNPSIFKRTGLWVVIKSVVKLLSLHQRAVVTANHPLRLLERKEFEETD